MVDQSQIHHLMAEIGPVLGLAGVAEYGEGDVWALVVDDNLEILARLDPTAGCLVLTADIGTPIPERQSDLYKTLLLYNNQRDRTGGVQMALAAPDGPVVQSLVLSSTDLTIEKLADVLTGFIEINLGWREIITGANPDVNDASEAPGDGPPDEPPPGALRV
ncbi:MAG: type III secretion system chaperone [Pseudomonadota bacterium]